MFQLLIADVALDGDIRQVVHRGIDNPITAPEALILEFIHGPATVTDIRSVGEIARTQAEERKRLVMTYGKQIVDQLFPGVMSQLPTERADAVSMARSPRGIQRTKEAKEEAILIAQASAGGATQPFEETPVVAPDLAAEELDVSNDL